MKQALGALALAAVIVVSSVPSAWAGNPYHSGWSDGSGRGHLDMMMGYAWNCPSSSPGKWSASGDFAWSSQYNYCI